ncbi:MAG: nitrate- and nitrite sensing domain-containing protein [Rhodocyclaceae bacterium]|nr:nitrate- and nitrite sensing domain-containing protein [Rhodocyclaceae bacterium]
MWVRAKEYLGQARATVLAMPGKGRPDPAWHAAMGSRFGLFEAGIQRFLKESSPSMRATLTGALGEPAMQSSMRLLRAARDGRAIDPISMPRTRWYGIVTEAINLLREVERYSLIELIDQTQAIHDKVRAEILLQRGGLLLISVLPDLARHLLVAAPHACVRKRPAGSAPGCGQAGVGARGEGDAR